MKNVIRLKSKLMGDHDAACFEMADPQAQQLICGLPLFF